MLPERLESLYLPYPGREDRLVRVFVPAREEGETLPVVYMTDGQNLFDVESSGFGCWFTREAVRAEREQSGRAAIIVGIHNDNPLRESELTPASVGRLELPPNPPLKITPAGETFDAFLLHTVMPAVEARFPVRKGRRNTAFCGSSCGGMMATFTVLSHPEVYAAGGLFSPAWLLFSQADLIRWIGEKLGPEKPFLHIYTGAGDPLEREIFESVQTISPTLREAWPADRLLETAVPEHRHHESAWEPEFRTFLRRFLSET